MHSIYARINNISAFLSSCTLALLGAIALSSFVFTASPHGDVAVANIRVLVTSAVLDPCLAPLSEASPLSPRL